MTNDNQQNKPFKEHQEFIVAEFGYIAQTAFQAHEDRARVSEFFLISFGAFLAALFSSEFSNVEPKLIYKLFSILFLIIAFWGALTVLELARLRLAWLESVRSMNCMKDYLVNRCSILDDCFRWRTNTIPKPFKLRSIGFLKALEVSVLSSISLGAAVSFIVLSFGSDNVVWWLSLLVAGVSAFLNLIVLYYLPLRETDQNHEN